MPVLAGSGRDSRNRSSPTFGTCTALQRRFNRRTVTSRTQKPSFRPALRQDGLRWVPAKYTAIAWSKSRSACCWTLLDPLASQSLSARASASWRNRTVEFGGGRLRPATR